MGLTVPMQVPHYADQFGHVDATESLHSPALRLHQFLDLHIIMVSTCPFLQLASENNTRHGPRHKTPCMLLLLCRMGMQMELKAS